MSTNFLGENFSRKDAKTQRSRKYQDKLKDFASFFAALRLCVRSFARRE